MDAWLEFLRDISVIDRKLCADLKAMHASQVPSVSNKAIVFAKRMQEEHPELWLSFLAKQRVLGLSKF